MTQAEVRSTLQTVIEQLLDGRNARGHWTGELSSSALSTATATIALFLAHGRNSLVDRGLAWLERAQNEDGGWSDTELSKSNISTTALCWAAFATAGGGSDAKTRCEQWIHREAGSLEPRRLAEFIASRYGSDRTFSVPILTVLAVAGLVPWRLVPQLPFELAACPQSWFRWLQLPVVSYALPALIAIGHVRHRRCSPGNPIACIIRAAASKKTLGVLEKIQPSNGGFLEAIPLTSFVAISLRAAGYTDSTVLLKCLRFLESSVRSNGSWPIDTNLATWVTTLSVNALRDWLPLSEREGIREWLLNQQYKAVHPYTGAAPGGWAWTDLPGGVPDADDTAGALIALKNLGCADARVTGAVHAGVKWLLDVQNSDGGIPTFCRGWGKLPFDRSSPDITAHTLIAWSAWRPFLHGSLGRQIDRAATRALAFLAGVQRSDGAWIPLWFGNQFAPGEENPVYGTSRVVSALNQVAPAAPMTQRGIEWLLAAQNEDGGWGGDRGIVSTVEETSLALTALSGASTERTAGAVSRAAAWLAGEIHAGRHTSPSPIGLYFAKLWYFERLYPLIFVAETMACVSSHPSNYQNWFRIKGLRRCRLDENRL